MTTEVPGLARPATFASKGDRAVRPAVVLLIAAAVVACTGCTSARARDWAQTGPPLPPDGHSMTAADVRLAGVADPAPDDRRGAAPDEG